MGAVIHLSFYGRLAVLETYIGGLVVLVGGHNVRIPRAPPKGVSGNNLGILTILPKGYVANVAALNSASLCPPLRPLSVPLS